VLAKAGALRLVGSLRRQDIAAQPAREMPCLQARHESTQVGPPRHVPKLLALSPAPGGCEHHLMASGNFPRSAATGKRAENRVGDLFTDWGWSVGCYWIDSGYDFTVMPDRGVYKGRQFLVQCKGTIQRKRPRVLTAPVSKSRLRTYAECEDPVIIVRTAVDFTHYWVHAQEWCEAHRARLDGAGASGVRFDPACRLDDRQAFESFLRQVFERTRAVSTSSQPLALADAGPAQSSFGMPVPGEQMRMTFQPVRTDENMQKLREVIQFGLPNTVAVDALRVHREDVDKFREPLEPLAGHLTISSEPAETGTVYLYPGFVRSVSVQPLAIPTDLFQGQGGAAVSTVKRDGIVDLSILFEQVADKADVKLTLGIRHSRLSQTFLREFDQLALIGLWAEQVMAHEGFYAEIVFPHGRMPLRPRREDFEIFENFVLMARTLGRVHLIARTLGWDYVVPGALSISIAEVANIDLAFGLLKGERRSGSVESFDFDSEADVETSGEGMLFFASSLAIAINGNQVGTVPIEMELPGYSVQRGEAGSPHRMVKGPQAEAWIFYAKHDFEGTLVRKDAP